MPVWPIIHSRPMVGVAKRVRTIDGMPTMNVSAMPPIPASRVIHDGRRCPSRNEHDRSEREGEQPDSGPEPRYPDLDIDGEREHARR